MPSIASEIINQKAVSGHLFSYNVGSHFNYEDSAIFSVKKCRDGSGYTPPSWISFDHDSKVISGIPGIYNPFTDEQVSQIEVKVTYGAVTVSQVFTLVVYADAGVEISTLPVFPKTIEECDYVLTPSTINSFNWSQVGPSQTIGLRGDLGNYSPFQINGLRSVANRSLLPGRGREVLMTNINGPVTITNSSSFGIKGINNNYLRMVGQGTAADPYGIKLMDGVSGIGIQFQYNNYEGFEFGYIQIENWGAIGVSIKNELGLGNNAGQRNDNPALSDDQSYISMHDCKLVGIGGEGLYKGTGFLEGRNFNNGLPYDDHVYFTGANASSRETLARTELPSAVEKKLDTVNNRWMFEMEGNNAPGGTTYDYLAGKGYIEGVDYIYVPAQTLYPHMIKHVRVFGNIVRNTLWDPIQCKNCDEDFECFDNFCDTGGTGNNGAHNEGIFVADGTTGKIYNNFVINMTGTGLRVYVTGSIDVYNNIVINCSDSVYGARSGLVGTGPRTYRCFNNTFINCPGQAFTCHTDIENIIFRNNLYINCGTSVSQSRGAGGSFVNSNNLWLTDVQAMLVDIEGGDYRLLEGSPAVGAGANMGIDTDYYDRPLNNPVDVGAIALGSEINPDRYSDYDYAPAVEEPDDFKTSAEFRSESNADLLNDLAHQTIYDLISPRITETINASRKVLKYEIFRSTSPDSGFVKIDEISEAVESYVDNTAVPGVMYYYRVRAIKYLSRFRDSAFSNIDSAVIASNLPVQTVKINFGSVASGAPGFNDITANGTVALNNALGTASGISVTTSGFSPANNGMSTGDTGTGYSLPNAVMQGSFSVGATPRNITITGRPGKKYKVILFGSRSSSGAGTNPVVVTDFTIGGVVKSLNIYLNTSVVVTYDNVIPNGSNVFVINVARNALNTINTNVNAIILEEYDNI